MINLIIPTLILSSIAIVIAVAALAMVIGMKLSTHTIEWKPLVTGELKEEDKFQEEEDNSEEILKSALDLSKKAKEKKKSVDPLEEILETNNF
jgi:multisubunit Na+/H+ antiporter MnhC subunit